MFARDELQNVAASRSARQGERSIPPLVHHPGRLAALTGLAILDTPAEAGFDDVVRLAARLCAAPVALVSLVDRDRQWFKARLGFPACETDLDRSVCKYALDEPDLLVIPDLSADPRTRRNPLVAEDPRIRFYAGAPLRLTSGEVVGSLCVIDTETRPGGLTSEQAEDLRALARQVVAQMELRATLRARDAAAEKERRLRETLRRNEERHRLLFENIDAGFCVIEMRFEDGEDGPRAVDYRFVEVNRAFEAQTGLANAAGRWMRDLAPDHEQHWFDLYGRVARTGEPARFENGAAALGRWYDVHALRVGEPGEGRVAVLFNDISARRAAEEAVKAGEAYWRGLFERLREGFIVGEVVRHADGRVADWRYVEVNRAWGALVGVDSSSVTGRTIRDVFPGIEDEWVNEFADVADSGKPIVFTRRVAATGRWYEGRAFALDADRFGVIFLEVTERVEANARREALLELGDRLRETVDPEAVAYAAAEIMGRTLAATRAGYGSVDARSGTVRIEPDWRRPGVASVSGPHRFRDFGSYLDDLKRGETVVLADVATDPRTRAATDAFLALGIRSMVNVPLVEHGALVAVLFIHDDKPRTWKEADLAFVRDVADRARASIARMRAEAERALLTHELAHRLKNSFAMVLSIASQTLRSAIEKGPVETFERRVHALSSAHDVLLQREWSSAPLDAVARAVLENVAPLERVSLSGPGVLLGSRATLSLSLVLHELATNALKYGALSNATGRVDLGWRIEGDDGDLVLVWEESGGPPAKSPSSRGFGSRLIRGGLLGLGGVDLDYATSGLRAEMRAPFPQIRLS